MEADQRIGVDLHAERVPDGLLHLLGAGLLAEPRDVVLVERVDLGRPGPAAGQREARRVAGDADDRRLAGGRVDRDDHDHVGPVARVGGPVVGAEQEHREPPIRAEQLPGRHGRRRGGEGVGEGLALGEGLGDGEGDGDGLGDGEAAAIADGPGEADGEPALTATRPAPMATTAMATTPTIAAWTRREPRRPTGAGLLTTSPFHPERPPAMAKWSRSARDPTGPHGPLGLVCRRHRHGAVEGLADGVAGA